MYLEKDVDRDKLIMWRTSESWNWGKTATTTTINIHSVLLISVYKKQVPDLH